LKVHCRGRERWPGIQLPAGTRVHRRDGAGRNHQRLIQSVYTQLMASGQRPEIG